MRSCRPSLSGKSSHTAFSLNTHCVQMEFYISAKTNSENLCKVVKKWTLITKHHQIFIKSLSIRIIQEIIFEKLRLKCKIQFGLSVCNSEYLMSSRPKRGNNPPALGCARRPLRPAADPRDRIAGWSENLGVTLWKSGGNPWSFEILGGWILPPVPTALSDLNTSLKPLDGKGIDWRPGDLKVFFRSCAKHTFTTQAETNICM